MPELRTSPPAPSVIGGVPSAPASGSPLGSRGVVADDLALPPGVQLRAAWAAARARNALRRQALILGVGLVTLLAALLTFVLVPREAMRAARQAAPRPGEKVDTVVLAASAATMRAVAARADSTIAAQRVAVTRALAAQAAARARAAAAAAGEATAARRGTLEAAVASLDRLLARAQTSPLPSSYRALAESPELRGDARVRVLADSLDEVEREREAFGVVGGVDPVYVSLTNTVTRLGRAIEAIAERRRSALQAELSESAGVGDVPGSGGGPAPEGGAAAAGGAGADAGRDVGATPGTAGAPGTPAGAAAAVGGGAPSANRGAGAPPGTQDATTTSAPPNPTNASGVVSTPRSLPTVPAVLSIDSSAESATRASARQRLAAIETQLSAARARNLAVDRRVTAARTRAEIETPPLAMLGASAALALAAGFGVAFASEARRPRVADAREAERVTRTRVLAVVHPEAVNPERARRRADADVPPLVDVSLESYRMLYLSMAATGASLSVVTLTGPEPAITAAVAANLAALSAGDGRSTLVVDADPARAAASIALGVGDRLGLTDVRRAGLPLAEAVVPVVVGRGLAIDVLTAGLGAPGPALAAAPSGSPHAESAAGSAGPESAESEVLRDELGRLARRYDLTVVSIPPAEGTRDAERVLVGPDVIVCARAGHTSLTGLGREIARLNAHGAHVRGLVLWDGEPPVVPTRAELSGRRSAAA